MHSPDSVFQSLTLASASADAKVDPSKLKAAPKVTIMFLK